MSKPQGPYNFDKKLVTAHYTIEVDTKAQYGCFEAHTGGEGGLWFVENELVDYDGFAVLPLEVAHALRNDGFVLEDVFFEE